MQQSLEKDSLCWVESLVAHRSAEKIFIGAVLQSLGKSQEKQETGHRCQIYCTKSHIS